MIHRQTFKSEKYRQLQRDREGESTYYRTDRRSPESDTTQDEFVSVQKAKAKIETRSNIFSDLVVSTESIPFQDEINSEHNLDTRTFVKAILVLVPRRPSLRDVKYCTESKPFQDASVSVRCVNPRTAMHAVVVRAETDQGQTTSD